MSELTVNAGGEIIPGVVTHLSPSAISTYWKCPRQYWYSYILKIKTPPGRALINGTAVHKAAEDGLVHKMNTGENPKPSDMAEVAVEEAKRLLAEPHEVPKHEHAGLIDQSARLGNAWGSHYAPKAKPLRVEADFSAIIAGWKVIGRIDLIDEDDGVVDWKTASRSPQESDFVLAPQSLIYPVVMPDVTAVTYKFLVPLSKGVNTPTVQVNGEGLERARRIAESTVDDVATLVNSGVFPRKTTGWHCSPKYCGHYNRCMAGKDTP